MLFKGQKNISIITIPNIRSGKLAKLIPEFYKLKNVIENDGSWHYKESVFNHSLSVLNSLDKIFLNLNKKTKQLLNRKIDKNARKNLLRVAAIFHDIGKKETMVTGKGLTLCLGHEAKGALKAKTILKRFKLSRKESKFITNIIEKHNSVHEILPTDSKNFSEKLANLKRTCHEVYPELLLLAFADTAKSYLAKTRPTEFKHRINFYKREASKL